MKLHMILVKFNKNCIARSKKSITYAKKVNTFLFEKKKVQACVKGGGTGGVCPTMGQDLPKCKETPHSECHRF